MSKLFYTINLNEVQTTKNGEFIKEYIANLPHAEKVANNLCESWNAIDWSKIFDGILTKCVEKSIMRPVPIEKDGVCKVRITTTFVNGFRLSAKRRNEFWEQMEAQMSDGWGEGIFGLINLIEFKDGAFGYID